MAAPMSDNPVCKKKKTVTFHTVVLVRDTMQMSEYTPKETASCWFSKDEYQRIARDCRAYINKLEKGRTLDGLRYCTRGLECRTIEGSRRILKNKREAIDIVLLAQSQGACNEKEIAMYYQEVTSSSQMFANLNGLRDQTTAQQYSSSACGIKQKRSSKPSSMRRLLGIDRVA